jgi:hypothetical protein
MDFGGWTPALCLSAVMSQQVDELMSKYKWRVIRLSFIQYAIAALSMICFIGVQLASLDSLPNNWLEIKQTCNHGSAETAESCRMIKADFESFCMDNDLPLGSFQCQYQWEKRIPQVKMKLHGMFAATLVLSLCCMSCVPCCGCVGAQQNNRTLIICFIAMQLLGLLGIFWSVLKENYIHACGQLLFSVACIYQAYKLQECQSLSAVPMQEPLLTGCPTSLVAVQPAPLVHSSESMTGSAVLGRLRPWIMLG